MKLPCGCEVSERRGNILQWLLGKAMRAKTYLMIRVYLFCWDIVHGRT